MSLHTTMRNISILYYLVLLNKLSGSMFKERDRKWIRGVVYKGK